MVIQSSGIKSEIYSTTVPKVHHKVFSNPPAFRNFAIIEIPFLNVISFKKSYARVIKK